MPKSYSYFNELSLGLDSSSNGINMIAEQSTVMIAGYFGVHFKNSSAPTYCGSLVHDAGITLVEAMRYAVAKINRKAFLFGKKLGFRIVDTCSNTATLRRSLFHTLRMDYYIGVVGPAASDEAILAAAVHSVDKAAAVSYSAASTVFKDRNTYYNFFSTIPSDELQVKALVDLISYFNWTYISTVNSYGTYGQRGVDNFVKELQQSKACVARRIDLPDSPSDNDFMQTVTELLSFEKAKVVILFTTQADTRRLLTAAKNVKTLTWVSSTGWYADLNVVDGVRQAANGSLIFQYAGASDAEFMNYFKNMTLKSNNYTWFREFWSEVFKCDADGKDSSKPRCSGVENLNNSSFFGKYAPVQPVLSAVESIVCALRKIMLKWCPSGNTTCIDRIWKRTYVFEDGIVDNLKRGDSSCAGLEDSVNFNAKGYYSRNFTILNFDGATYKEVGKWIENKTAGKKNWQIMDEKITWKGMAMPVSVCSLPCKWGEVKVSSSRDCCFTCRPCGNNDIIRNGSCVQCGEFEKASDDLVICKALPLVFIDVNSAAGWVIVIGSLTGILLNTMFLVVFVKFRTSRIVKASSRELSFIIILALYVCFMSPLTMMMRPSQVVCGLQRFIIGLSLTGCYTPLMLKTNRIYRIFKASISMISKPVLVGSKSQILICMGLLGVQLLLGIMWVVGDPPSVVNKHINNKTQVAVICKFDAFNVILNLIPCFVLMAICTVFAFKTRKFPTNFNEAYSIGLTMYVSCFLWGVFIPLILFLEIDKESVFVTIYVIASFTIIVGLITLLGLFGPKLSKLLFDNRVAPTMEMFSEFNSKRRESVPNSAVQQQQQQLATITEDESYYEHKNTAIMRLKTASKDASTNT